MKAEPGPDIISGVKEIATYLGITPRQVEWHDQQGHLPTFKMGKTVCARKSKLLEWIDMLEQDRRQRRVSKSK